MEKSGRWFVLDVFATLTREKRVVCCLSPREEFRDALHASTSLEVLDCTVTDDYSAVSLAPIAERANVRSVLWSVHDMDHYYRRDFATDKALKAYVRMYPGLSRKIALKYNPS